MRTAVFIGTNKGPVQIVRFVADGGLRAGSMMVGPNGSATGIQRTSDFAHFLNDVCRWGLARLGREPLPPHMLVMLEHDIDGGDSWQLGVLTAALLLAEGRFEPDLDAAEQVVLCTGSLKGQAESIGDVGLIAEKLGSSAGLIEDLRGRHPPKHCLWLLPLADRQALAADATVLDIETLCDAELLPIETVDELPAALGLRSSQTSMKPPPGPDPGTGMARRRLALGVAGFLIAAVVAALAGHYRANPSADSSPDTKQESPELAPGDTPAESPPVEASTSAAASLTIARQLVSGADDCRVANFQPGTHTMLEDALALPASGGALPPLVGEPRLCGVVFTVAPQAAAAPTYARLVLTVDPAEAVSVDRAAPLDGQQLLGEVARALMRIQPFKLRGRRLAYGVVLITGPEPVPVDPFAAEGPPALRAELAERGFTVQSYGQDIELP